VVAILALLLSELFLDLVLNTIAEKSLAFTNGVQTADARFGFVFTPHYRGWMRHADHVFLVPLELDQYGFRLPAITQGSRQNVLVLGGRSMMFTYGMTDDQTVPHEIDAALKTPSTVYDVAWPGFELFRIFHVYRETLGKHLYPDFTIITFYQDQIDSFADLPADLSDYNLVNPDPDVIFHYYDHIALDPPKGLIALALDKLFYQSVILHKTALRLDRWTDVIMRRPSNFKVPGATGDLVGGARHFKQFTAYLQQYFGGRDKVLFVFLPGIAWSGLDMTPDYYDPLVAALPPEVHYLDLNRELGVQVRANGYVAMGHYVPASTTLLGRAIGKRINEIQSAATDAPDAQRNAVHP
jgi:hypothetical protein